MASEIVGAPESPLLTPRVSLDGLERDDIVVRKGQFTLLNGHLTPQQSMVEDLFFVKRVLDESHIAHLLVRGNGEQPVIALDSADRETFETAMVTATKNEPFYAKP